MTVDRHKPNFEFSNHNELPDLMELTFFVPQGADENSFFLGAETRFGTMTVILDDYDKVVEFGLSTATLRLELQGCELNAQRRLGDQSPSAVKTKISSRNLARSTRKFAIGAAVRAKIDAKNTDAAVSAEASAKKKGVQESETVERQQYDETQEPVVALSGNRWQFTAIKTEYMTSRYSGDEAICAITATSGSVQVVGKLSFYPKNLFLIDGACGDRRLTDLFRGQPTKTALAKVLLAKYLRNLNETNEAGGAIHGAKVVLKGVVRD